MTAVKDLGFGTILNDVAAYYGSRLAEYGTTARGVDWNGLDSQLLRFAQLARLLPDGGSFSINDVGCGYGALFDFLRERFSEFSYRGTDVSPEMIGAARNRLGIHENAQFSDDVSSAPLADYSVASGIFNVRLKHGDEEWKTYFLANLDTIADMSRNGFAFNCLTSYADPGRMQEHLYYADPCAIFDLCKRRYSRQVALLHDYGLYEFTILVRKET